MTIAKQYGKPSTLTAVIRQFMAALDAMGYKIPVLIGKKHLKQGGVVPRIVFVPEDGGGSIGAGINLGDAASHIHSCTVNVRTREGLGDLQRFDETYALFDMAVSLVETAAPGRLEFGAVEDQSPSDTDCFGAGLSFSFRYRRAIEHDPARWALPPASQDSSGARPHPPPGTLLEGATIEPTTELKE